MKRSKLFLTVTLVLFLCNVTIAQDYIFRVLAKKGENSISSDGKTWAPLKTGSALMSGQSVKTGEGAYLGLVHTSGKTLEIRKPGIKSIKELSSTINIAEASVTTKYVNFMMDKMSASNEDIDQNHRKYLNATGAVTRGMHDPIKMLLPSKSKFYGKEAILKWTELEDEKLGKSPIYVLTLTDIFDEVILQAETQDLNYKVNFDEGKIKHEPIIIIQVHAKDSPSVGSSQYTIERLNNDKAQPILSELNQLIAITKDETAMNKLILASFYEQHNLMMDAMTNYKAAADLAPDIPVFQHAYEQFVLTNALGTK